MNYYRQFLLLLAFATPLFASPWPVDENKIKFPYEQPPKTKPEPSFPDNFTNVALNKKVVVGPANVRLSYSLPIIGDLTSVTDGMIDNRTEQGGTYDEGMYASMADVPHYIQIDLEENFRTQAVWLWYRHLTERWDVPYGVIVQLSNDQEFKNDVVTVYNCDVENSFRLGAGTDKHFATSKYGKLIQFPETIARYVRVWGSSSARLSVDYVEVEVYGKPKE